MMTSLPAVPVMVSLPAPPLNRKWLPTKVVALKFRTLALPSPTRRVVPVAPLPSMTSMPVEPQPVTPMSTSPVPMAWSRSALLLLVPVSL